MARFYSFHVTDKNERKEKKKKLLLCQAFECCALIIMFPYPRVLFLFLVILLRVGVEGL